MIEIRGLNKSFGNLHVLKDINLNIENGKIVGLAGRSGEGKSTLLRCINGLESYDSGILCVDGMEVKSLRGKDQRAFRKNIGMIFQQFSLLNRLDIYNNIALPMSCWGFNRKQIDYKVKSLLEIVDLSDKIHAMPHELSGGQKQRVAIARALTLEPKILLCDEATSALDPKTSQSILNLLKQINQDLGLTIVIVTHQMSVLKSACEKIAILQNSKIAEISNAKDIFMDCPPALANLVGKRDIYVPSSGYSIEIFQSDNEVLTPVVTTMAKTLDIDCVILNGEINTCANGLVSSTIIHLQSCDEEKVKKYLSMHNIRWKSISNNNNE